MKVLHAFWLPEPGDAFMQSGALRLWAETLERAHDRRHQSTARHPFHLPRDAWPACLEALGAEPAALAGADDTCTLQLPSSAEAPLPSPQLGKYWPDAIEEAQATLRPWAVDCLRLTHPIKQLSELHFLAFYRAADVEPGTDFLFWYWFTQELKRLLVREQYLPALVCRGVATRKQKGASSTIYGAWRWASEPYERLIATACERMPGACATGTEGLADTETLLRHCAEVLLDESVRQTPLPATFEKKLAGTLLSACLGPTAEAWQAPASGLPGYRHWQAWHRRVAGSPQQAAFSLGFRLLDPPAETDDHWALQFVAIPRDDPSQRLALADYWSLRGAAQEPLHRQLGEDFETELLLNLGLAARMVPKLWEGLDTAQPQAVTLDLDEAFAFLNEWAWVLEDAGFKIIVPAWWTPQGRRRIRLRLRSSAGRKAHGAAPTAGGLSLDHLVQYRYELAIGDQLVTPEEWQQLVEAKTPLVRFRGEWVALDRERMQEMLAFWRRHGSEVPEMSLQELLRRTATDDTLEVDPGDALAAMLERLRDHSRLEPIGDLPGLQAELRDYQKRGVAWLRFLEGLGLNGCLADDMGLGKTIQVIARLVEERAGGAVPGPTLLVAPTSVIGNWQKEVQRFAPRLSTLVHHGPGREQNAQEFQQAAAGQALVITSYPLVRRDQALFTALDWHRVVLDEAQNIKNPQAAQTKAVTRLRARHRLALTGTPIENRLMDLWSIFHFTNPGYLDTQARFRNRFELPVQRDNNPVQTAALKRLVEPFILRRVKTDKAIIRDLPDKLEAIQYCNLSREQAALYEGVVREVERELETKDGIARKGLMLATLMRLKQICNHPAQFLQDGSPFTPERSHKLERLEAMLDEVMAEGDSVLIFSQFTEIGGALERRLRQELRHNTFFLHGGTPRSRREAMISAFQDPQGEPAVFVLSLKAGGVGITLTKANHVFHFDRWWNPAVEDQASDRAYRIGQEKTVFVHKLVTLGTLEERINDMIAEKKTLADSIVGTDESWLTQLDNERFKDLIRLNRAAVVD
jgi:SNF2 family DNA or RNA helicase